jgi:hypothetical protein
MPCWSARANAELQTPASREADAANESNRDLAMVTVNAPGEELAG